MYQVIRKVSTAIKSTANSGMSQRLKIQQNTGAVMNNSIFKEQLSQQRIQTNINAYKRTTMKSQESLGKLTEQQLFCRLV